MWIPEWLYERLPHIYFAIGVACLWFLGHSVMGMTSAAALFTAALLISLRRRGARQGVSASTARRPLRR